VQPQLVFGPNLTASPNSKMPHQKYTDHSGAAEASKVPQEQLQLREHSRDDTAEPPRKKSLSFKLAFAGLALLLLVFQVDATCLSIALPVSKDGLLGLHFAYTPC
jgi:hypothetical protein